MSESGDKPRYQPEFSPGERLARVEALIIDLQPQLDRRFIDAEKLFNEKLMSLHNELTAINNAQKEAVGKAEKSATQRFEAFVGQNDRKSEVVNNRISALEREGSLGQGSQRRSREINTAVIAWAGIALFSISIAVGLLIKFV